MKWRVDYLLWLSILRPKMPETTGHFWQGMMRDVSISREFRCNGTGVRQTGEIGHEMAGGVFWPISPDGRTERDRQTGVQTEEPWKREGESERGAGCAVWIGRQWAVGSESVCLCEVCEVTRQPRPSHLPVYRSLVRLTFPGSLGALLPDCSAICSPPPNGKALKSRGRPPAQSLSVLPVLPVLPQRPCQGKGKHEELVCTDVLCSVQGERENRQPGRITCLHVKTSRPRQLSPFNLWRSRLGVPDIRTRCDEGGHAEGSESILYLTQPHYFTMTTVTSQSHPLPAPQRPLPPPKSLRSRAPTALFGLLYGFLHHAWPGSLTQKSVAPPS